MPILATPFPINNGFAPPAPKMIGNEVTLYASKDGENIIDKGYNLNAVVYTCLNHIQKMFGKIPFYVVEINPDEKKTFAESQRLIKLLHDPRAIAEAKRMRKKSLDGIIEDNNLAKFLNRPNRNQTGVAYRQMLVGYKKLTGEGNGWLNRGVDEMGNQATDRAPLEMFVIPKYILQLIGNGFDPWEILKYQITLVAGQHINVPKENIQMWIENNFKFVSTTLDHLRGQPPLEAALLQIQGLNEGAIREIKESVNGGANGLLFRKDAKEMPKDPGTVSWMREQINNAVNGKDVAGAIAWMAGEWGYLPFGKTSQELQRVELSARATDDICNVLGVPPGLLKANQTYENANSYFRQFIYQTIAPEAYGLRDLWNNTLLDMFGMDREKYAIDCDILSLPELAEDMKNQVSAVQNADWLSKNEKRIATGYEPIEDGDYDLVPKDSAPIEIPALDDFAED